VIFANDAALKLWNCAWNLFPTKTWPICSESIDPMSVMRSDTRRYGKRKVDAFGLYRYSFSLHPEDNAKAKAQLAC
jgi:hypothetical protein